MSAFANAYQEADALPDVPPPALCNRLVGHDDAVNTLRRSRELGKFGQAWIFAGPRGIGKATLAFQLAKALLGGHNDADFLTSSDINSPESNGTRNATALINSGAHPDLIYINRAFDEKSKKFRSGITVSDIRRLSRHLRSTAGLDGWRICIIDAADNMNRNAANVLLKILEEPLPKTMFMLIAHQPGRLLATIRSRCRFLPMRPLDGEKLKEFGQPYFTANNLQSETSKQIIVEANGIPREVVMLLDEDYRQLQSTLNQIFKAPDNVKTDQLLGIADMVSKPGSQKAFIKFLEMSRNWLQNRLHEKVRCGIPAPQLIPISRQWEKIHKLERDADIYNLDRHHLVVNLFTDLSRF